MPPARSGPCHLPCPQLLPMGERVEQDWPVEDTVGLCPGSDSSGPLPAPDDCQHGCGAQEGGSSPSPVQRPLTDQWLQVCPRGRVFRQGGAGQRKARQAGEKEEAGLSAYPGA